MRLFADHCVPESVATALEADGHEVSRLRDHLKTDAPDPEVIEKAQELDAVLLSLNGDFSDIVSYPPSSYGGIIALQVRNRPEVLGEITDRLAKYLKRHPERQHYHGKLLLVEAHRLRIRPSTT